MDHEGQSTRSNSSARHFLLLLCGRGSLIVQASDAWLEADLQDLLDTICSRACLVLEDFSHNPPGHPSDLPLNERSRL
jgi:hypothetical protein